MNIMLAIIEVLVTSRFHVKSENKEIVFSKCMKHYNAYLFASVKFEL